MAEETVAQMLRQYSGKRDTVLKAMYEEWPHEEDNDAAYRKVWDALSDMGGKPTDCICVVYRVTEPLSGDLYIDVSGIVPGDPQHYAIEYEPWEEWLSMPVRIVGDVSREQALGNILYEMTWAGYDQNIIQDDLAEVTAALGKKGE